MRLSIKKKRHIATTDHKKDIKMRLTIKEAQNGDLSYKRHETDVFGCGCMFLVGYLYTSIKRTNKS